MKRGIKTRNALGDVASNVCQALEGGDGGGGGGAGGGGESGGGGGRAGWAERAGAVTGVVDLDMAVALAAAARDALVADIRQSPAAGDAEAAAAAAAGEVAAAAERSAGEEAAAEGAAAEGAATADDVAAVEARGGRAFSEGVLTALLPGRGLHLFTLELNLSNSKTHSGLSWVTQCTEELKLSRNRHECKPLLPGFRYDNVYRRFDNVEQRLAAGMAVGGSSPGGGGGGKGGAKASSSGSALHIKIGTLNYKALCLLFC